VGAAKPKPKQNKGKKKQNTNKQRKPAPQMMARPTRTRYQGPQSTYIPKGLRNTTEQDLKQVQSQVSSNIAEAARTMMLPDQYCSMLTPQLEANGRLEYFPVQNTFAFTLDVLTMLNRIARHRSDYSARASQTYGSDGAFTLLWEVDSGYPVVQMMDYACLAAFPVAGNAVPGEDYTNARLVTYSARTSPAADVWTSGEYISLPLDFLSTGEQNITCLLPDVVYQEFSKRIPFRGRDNANSSRTWVWIDSAKDPVAQASINLSGNATIEVIDYYGSPTDFVFELVCYYKGPNFSETKTKEFVVSVPAGAPGFIYATFSPMSAAEGIRVQGSGFYAFEVQVSQRISGTGNPADNYYRMQVSPLELYIREYTTDYTAFVLNPNANALAGVASSYWPLGSGMLVSFRNPPLNSGGTIYGARFTQELYNFNDASHLTVTQMCSKVPASAQFHGTSGGSLLKGLWSWHCPAIWPRSVLPTRIVNSDDDSEVAAYWVGKPESFSAIKLVKINPTAFGDSAEYLLRFHFAVAIAAVPRGQTIKGTHTKPMVPDEWAALNYTMSAVPTFSENDWHSFFSKVASSIGKVGSFLMRGATTTVKALGPIAQLAGSVGRIGGEVSNLSEGVSALALL
jgi:hypothetical protein